MSSFLMRDVISSKAGTLHVSLDEEFVLLGILATDHEIVLCGDEPMEFFKPVCFSQLVHASHCLCLLHLCLRRIRERREGYDLNGLFGGG